MGIPWHLVNLDAEKAPVKNDEQAQSRVSECSDACTSVEVMLRGARKGRLMLLLLQGACTSNSHDAIRPWSVGLSHVILRPSDY